jgi:SAM-dependent methyltransferase
MMETDKTYDLAPGNILQNMYLKHRLKKYYEKTTFIEVGSGNGNISTILLESGMRGIGFDLNKTACNINRIKNTLYIESGMYTIENSDFFEFTDKKVDIIISSHVIEHFSKDTMKAYFGTGKPLKKKGGGIISLVPSSMKYWGIEDETTGHYRRFEFSDFVSIANENGFTINHIAGLTFPISNLLFGLSNYLINKNDGWKKNLSKEEQTKFSSSGGAKHIKFKTNFPYWFRWIINEVTMYPFFLLQTRFKKNKSSMVIYCEYKMF